MYTYEDLLKDTGVECENVEEFNLLVEFLKSNGHCLSFDHISNSNVCVDILSKGNPERNIMISERGFYARHGYRIIKFNELVLEDNLEEILQDFESLLLE